MASAPGSFGIPLIGDKSIEFYRDAVHFVDKKVEQLQSRVFATRFLNKPTVFIASNSGVWELLNEKSSCTEFGYKAFMQEIYGDNILFTDGSDADARRAALGSILSAQDTSEHFDHTLNRLTEKYLKDLDARDSHQVYTHFKKLSTEICLTIFLDVDFEESEALAEQIVSLTTNHWHGIISVPFNLKLPMMNKSTYGQALDAKEKLLNIIREKLRKGDNGIAQRMVDINPAREDIGVNHLLLFTSALIPKALSSILTSFVVALANRKSYIKSAASSPDTLEHLLLEVMRMWPPLLGGRRIAKEDFTVQGIQICRGQAVVYMTHHAQRDPSVFADPDNFCPDRWVTRNAGGHDKLFMLGSGPRDCIGKHMVWKILKEVCGSLVKMYSWDICENQPLKYKWLPVTRPVEDVSCRFTTNNSNKDSGQEELESKDEINN